MIDDFFQQKPKSDIPDSDPFWKAFVRRSLFYTSVVGFFLGAILGYFHLRGWLTTADEGLLIYAMTFGVGALLSTSFVLYQLHQNKRQLARAPKSRSDK